MVKVLFIASCLHRCAVKLGELTTLRFLNITINDLFANICNRTYEAPVNSRCFELLPQIVSLVGGGLAKKKREVLFSRIIDFAEVLSKDQEISFDQVSCPSLMGGCYFCLDPQQISSQPHRISLIVTFCSDK